MVGLDAVRRSRALALALAALTSRSAELDLTHRRSQRNRSCVVVSAIRPYAPWALGLAATGLTIWWLAFPSLPVRMPPGQLAPSEPTQLELTDGRTWTRGELLITAIAELELTAKLLGRERYWFDREASLSPVDLCLGWGPMSDQAVVDRIDISQFGRWYHWSTDAPVIPADQIAAHSANMHILPADDAVAAFVKQARPGRIIALRGYLVEVQADDGWRWRSSLSRTDTGEHSCEVFWVEHAWDPLETSTVAPRR